jgi:hypothetical protein
MKFESFKPEFHVFQRVFNVYFTRLNVIWGPNFEGQILPLKYFEEECIFPKRLYKKTSAKNFCFFSRP